MTWVGAFDQSRDRVPVSRMSEAYDAGYRVAGFYAGGGSPSKWPPKSEVEAWLGQGPDTGVAGLFEIKGTEPIDSPSSGAAHARAARAAWRKLGYPDHCSIFVAVDRDVSLAQARAELTTYYRAWASADTCLPVGYVEDDAGEILVAEGILAGIFTPAAWGWNNPPVLYTPKNAPPHVVWTQEHNGQLRYGGDLDLGHIRTTAPIWWRQPSNPGDGEIVMPLTQADADLVAKTLLAARVDNLAPPKDGEPVSLGQATRMTYYREGYEALTGEPAELKALAAIQSAQATQAATLAGLPAAIAQAVVAALPDPSGGLQGLTAVQVQDIVETAAADVLGRTSLTVAPPATG